MTFVISWRSLPCFPTTAGWDSSQPNLTPFAYGGDPTGAPPAPDEALAPVFAEHTRPRIRRTWSGPALWRGRTSISGEPEPATDRILSVKEGQSVGARSTRATDPFKHEPGNRIRLFSFLRCERLATVDSWEEDSHADLLGEVRAHIAAADHKRASEILSSMVCFRP